MDLEHKALEDLHRALRASEEEQRKATEEFRLTLEEERRELTRRSEAKELQLRDVRKEAKVARRFPSPLLCARNKLVRQSVRVYMSCIPSGVYTRADRWADRMDR